MIGIKYFIPITGFPSHNLILLPLFAIYEYYVHRLNNNFLPNTFNNIGLASKIFIKGGAVRELHDERGALHLSLVIQKAAGTHTM